jgi:hypothetical protein
MTLTEEIGLDSPCSPFLSIDKYHHPMVQQQKNPECQSLVFDEILPNPVHHHFLLFMTHPKIQLPTQNCQAWDLSDNEH